VNPCPDNTYSDGSACQSNLEKIFIFKKSFQGCSDSNCKTCDSTKCLTCDTNYLLYDGGCVNPCPDKTYSDETSCIGKHYSRAVFVTYFSALACSQDHCAECNAAGCTVCDADYELNTSKKCVSPTSPTTPSTEEAGSSGGGLSAGAIAGIVCGSAAIIAIVCWSVYSFMVKQFPFHRLKRYLFSSLVLKFASAPKNPSIGNKSSPALEASSPVSPISTEVNPLVP